jgi:riboflavin synthase alpha subunit
MFTGIVEEVGEVVDARRRQLRVSAAKVLERTKLGDSIAVDGVDLTVTAVAEQALGFDVMPETYRQTTLRLFRQGQRVNLERSVRGADRLSGHLVRGVVEGVGRVQGLRRDGDAIVITYSAPEHVFACIVDRGPICVDGVSLTVIAKGERTFSVSIVAFTAAHTNVLERAVGDPVNLESDIIMRYVAQAVENRRRFADAASSEPATLSLARDPLLAPDSSLVDLFEAVRALPFGRPRDRSVAGLLRERRGTCSTKHLFLAHALVERFPETKPQIVQRVYRADREQIRELYGDRVAAVVPREGLVDVHRYLRIQFEGRRITLDATFPARERWDGRSSLPVACGPGDDIVAGNDPDADKRMLEERYCDPAVREPFIAALSAVTDVPR